MDGGHEFRLAGERIVVLLEKCAGCGVQCGVWVGIYEEAGDCLRTMSDEDQELSTVYGKDTYDQNILQGQVGLPVPLQCIHADRTRRFLYIWMPYPCPECGLWWTLRIVLRHLQMQSP